MSSELQALDIFLKEQNLREDYPLHFREESEADNRYALRVTCGTYGDENNPENVALARKLAEYFGCPTDELPDDTNNFEASGSWHGNGDGDLRNLADELAIEYEPFFDMTLTPKEIAETAAAWEKKNQEIQEGTGKPAGLGTRTGTGGAL